MTVSTTHLILIICTGLYCGSLLASTSHESVVLKNLVVNEDSDEIYPWGTGGIHAFNRNMDVFVSNKFSETSPGIYAFFLGPVALLIALIAMIVTRERSFVFLFVFIAAQHFLAFQQGEMLPESAVEKQAMEIFSITAKIRLYETLCVAAGLIVSLITVAKQSKENLKTFGLGLMVVCTGTFLFSSHLDLVQLFASRVPKGMEYVNGYYNAVMPFLLSFDSTNVTWIAGSIFSLVLLNHLTRIVLVFRGGWLNILACVGTVMQFWVGYNAMQTIPLDQFMVDGIMTLNSSNANLFFNGMSATHLLEGRFMLIGACLSAYDILKGSQSVDQQPNADDDKKKK